MKINNKKGIILAGGSGTRLHPITKVISKQLLPIYDEPMVYYPLSTLINSGVKDVLIITKPEDKTLFKNLLDNYDGLDVNIDFETQEEPEGIAQAFIIAKKWLGESESILILGDNLFFGIDLNLVVNDACENNKGATIFAYKVDDPNRFGVIEFDNEKNVISIEEKPEKPKSNWVATGMYIYDQSVVSKVLELKKSDRGELEITDLNNIYLEEKNLKVVLLDDNFKWLDTGTHETLLEASNTVKDIKDKFGSNIIGLK